MSSAHPENLVSLLEALFSSRAVLQNAGHKYPHIVASGQTQPHALPLLKLHQLHTGPEGERERERDKEREKETETETERETEKETEIERETEREREREREREKETETEREGRERDRERGKRWSKKR